MNSGLRTDFNNLFGAVGQSARGFITPYWISDEIDLTKAGVYDVVPPLPGRFSLVWIAWQITETSGDIEAGPTYKIGSNPTAYDNLGPEVAGAFTGAVNTSVYPVLNTAVPAMGEHGIRVKVSAGATGTTLKARLALCGMILPE